jgi:dUTPase
MMSEYISLPQTALRDYFAAKVLQGILSYRSEFGTELVLHNGARIAQAMILPVQQVQFEEVAELSETVRGAGGFGSSGSC